MSYKNRVERKEKTHRDIINSAAMLIRKEGISGASVSKVMKGAGKTVGGFYAHFRSKQHVVADALQHAISQNIGFLTAGFEKASAHDQYSIAIRRYLSRRHRDLGKMGCPLPGCLSEIETADEVVTDVFIESIHEMAERILPMFEDKEGLSAQERTLGTIATMVGALSLARATKGSPLSDKFLKAGKKMLFYIENEGK